MKFAITGGTGFLGRIVAQHLAAERHDLVLVARGVLPLPPALANKPGVRLVRANVAEPGPLAGAFDGCDVVIHCAGIRFERGKQTFEAVHRDGTARVLEAARKAGVRKIVLLSFLRARPACGSSYHETKWAAEEMVRHSGLDYTVLKCGVIYGPGDHMLNHLSHGFHTFPVFGLVGYKDEGIRPVAVEDVVEIIRAAVVEGAFSGRTLAVLGPEFLSFRDAMRRVASVVGREPLMFRMPVWFHWLFAWCLERCMRVPMISLAQVRMMVEGVAEPAPACEAVSEPYAPKSGFTTERIRMGLPPPGPFTRADLLGCGASDSAQHPCSRHHSRVFFEMP